mmetsp:Transcript_19320/g.28591  ORF Transcript_19320/g.28591 Transcript_19320/m.28591 type:complete len:374 (-) Transcript_19320:8-1129(-)
MTDDNSCSGRLPSWWLEGVLHDTYDDQLRQRRLSNQAESDDSYYSKEKTDLSDTSSYTSSSGSELSDTKSSSQRNRIINQTLIENSLVMDKISSGVQSDDDEMNTDGTNISRKLDIRMTSEEEAAAVEARRNKSTKAEIFGQSVLKNRAGSAGDSKAVDYNDTGSQGLYGVSGGMKLSIKMTSEEEAAAVEARRAQYAPSIKIGPELLKKRANNRTVDSSSKRDANKSIPMKIERPKEMPTEHTKSPSHSIVKTQPKTPQEGRKMNFVGLSPFDFAMKQKKLMKERREKERRDREGLARHHGGTLELEISAKKKAKQEEERKKRTEAEQNLKAFKTIGIEKKNEHTAELKMLQMQDKQRKKEAEEHLKGYRER